ncbi:MAG: YggS family pyridoxal phosphate-dependent enzyme [Planctomycetota bacterium]
MNESAGAGDRLAAVEARITAACRSAGRSRDEVQLLAVSKTFPLESITALHARGQSDFGENRVQELVDKAMRCPHPEVRWHMIGSLQTNKVAALCRVTQLAMLHSVDRVKLVDALEFELARSGRRLDVLIEINASGEVEKHGVEPDGAAALAGEVLRREHLELRGLMTMGPREGDPIPAFRQVDHLRRELEQSLGRALPVLSMGMSGDLESAIAAGSTLVRIGSALFGER